MLKTLVASPLRPGDLKCHIPRQCRSVCNMHMRISGFESHLHVISHLHLHLGRFQEESLVIDNNSLFSFNVNKNPTRCNSMQIFIHCKVTLHVSGVTAPIIRITKNCNHSLRYSYFPPTWPDQATLEGISCTIIMTCTGGCGYSF